LLTERRSPGSSGQRGSARSTFQWRAAWLYQPSSPDGMTMNRLMVRCPPSFHATCWFDDRTAENVASASTSVPPAVASDEIVCQSATAGP
jgi:hypothetical protein